MTWLELDENQPMADVVDQISIKLRHIAETLRSLDEVRKVGGPEAGDILRGLRRTIRFELSGVCTQLALATCQIALFPKSGEEKGVGE